MYGAFQPRHRPRGGSCFNSRQHLKLLTLLTLKTETWRRHALLLRSGDTCTEEGRDALHSYFQLLLSTSDETVNLIPSACSLICLLRNSAVIFSLHTEHLVTVTVYCVINNLPY